MSWNYFNPVNVIVGAGKVNELPRFINGSVLIVTTRGSAQRGHTGLIRSIILNSPVYLYEDVRANPDIADIENAVGLLGELNIETIVALGGGSTIDFAKALSFALANGNLALRAYLFESKSFILQTIPIVAIPTTAGTGSEVTPFATIWDFKSYKKYSLSSNSLFVRTAILDVELTMTLSWAQTLASGLDALSHAFESIWNKTASPVTQLLAIEAIKKIPNALITLKGDMGNVAAREVMMEASLLSGIAISCTRTAVAHSISYPLTAHFGLPHGLACSFTLPVLWRYNAQKNVEWAARIARQLGAQSSSELEKEILVLFGALSISKEILSYIKKYQNLYPLIPEMITPGRSENMLRPVDQNSIRAILKDTERILFA